jgi:GNAT superfamily N-acetyltransferase
MVALAYARASETIAAMNLTQAQTPEQIDQARHLFKEYADWLQIDLCFQNFEKELAELPGDYVPPGGRLLLAYDNAQLAGCVALRRINQSICEMKRLFLREEFRGRGLGRQLIAAIIQEARQIGYRYMRLDTLPPKMIDAISLYRSYGFKEIDPYYENPVPGALFMELDL